MEIESNLNKRKLADWQLSFELIDLFSRNETLEFQVIGLQEVLPHLNELVGANSVNVHSCQLLFKHLRNLVLS